MEFTFKLVEVDNQSFIYSGIRPPELRSRFLEVTVWDYDRYGSNEFLGEINLDLGSTATGSNEEPLWHVLNMESAAKNNAMVREGTFLFGLELLELINETKRISLIRYSFSGT